MLPILLDEISHVPAKQIMLINATGTHRGSTPEELEKMLGRDIVGRYRIVNHDAFAKSTLTKVGKLADGTDVLLNKEFLKADKRILTGFIEPHSLAGFTGGPEVMAPGLAGIDTIMSLYSAQLVAHPKASWGVTQGNPLWEKICEAAGLVETTSSLNVTLNKQHEITNVFAGELWRSHAIGIEFARKTNMRAVTQTFDIVVTTNGGYPWDLNLCQTVKGMWAAAQIVKPGGAIVMASECSEGIPDQGNFKKLLRTGKTPSGLLQMLSEPGFSMLDQWEAQVQAQVQVKARVYLKAGYLSDQQIREAMLVPTSSVDACVNELLEDMPPEATVGVLPQGPLAIPFVHIREPLALV